MGYKDSNIDRLLSAFCLEESDRVPNLEYWVTSVPVLEYILGGKLPQSLDTWTTLAPEDMIEFARRIGMDAVGVYFSWRPGNIFKDSSNPITHDNYVDGCIKDWYDLENRKGQMIYVVSAFFCQKKAKTPFISLWEKGKQSATKNKCGPI